jgi:hypothetical protein
VLLEILLGEEGGAVDAGEHLAAGVASPVGAGDRSELERLDPAGRRPVRAAAEVGEGAVAVEGYRVHAVIANQVLDQLDLVVLPLRAEALDRLRPGQLAPLERLVGLDVLAHPGLDPLEVVLGGLDPFGEVEVVVEAVVDRGPDRDLHAWVELHHCRGEHVRGVVADEPQRAHAVLGAPRSDDLDPVPVVERRSQVAQVRLGAVTRDPDTERGAGEALADRPSGVGAGGAVGKLQWRAVGERDLHAAPKVPGPRSRSPRAACCYC